MKPTTEDVLKWARETLDERDGIDYYDYTYHKVHWWGEEEAIVKFAALAYAAGAAAEREECAKVEQLKRIAKLVEPEPVAWMHSEKYKTHFTTIPSEDLVLNGYWTPLYTTPPQQNLTPEEPNSVGVIDMARAIESKIKEKNHD